MVSFPSGARLIDPFARPIARPRRSMRITNFISVDDPQLLDAFASGDFRSKASETNLRAAEERINHLADMVAEFTGSLFNGAVAVRQESDPDFQSDYFVVSVTASGDVDQLVALNDQWHRGIRDVVGEMTHQFRLSLDVQ